MPRPTPQFENISINSPPEAPGIHIICMEKPPENRLNVRFAQSIISALRYIETELLGPDKEGAVILTSFSDKFWCTGVELEEGATNPHSGADGFYPLLATLLDFPYPTIALITGHTFGGACPMSLCCDYRIMNKARGFYCMPPVNLGLHFDGIGALPRLKLRPDIARKMLLQAHRWTGLEALKDGIVDEVAEPDKMLQRAIEVAKEHAPRAKMGVYGLLRNELYGDALNMFRKVSYAHHRLPASRQRPKI